MATRADLGAVPQPLRWLGHPALWALMAAAAVFLKSRRSDAGLGMAPLSADWLQDLERQTIRGRD